MKKDKAIEALKKVFPWCGAQFWYCLLWISAILIITGIGCWIMFKKFDDTNISLAWIASGFWLAIIIFICGFAAIAVVKTVDRLIK